MFLFSGISPKLVKAPVISEGASFRGNNGDDHVSSDTKGATTLRPVDYDGERDFYSDTKNSIASKEIIMVLPKRISILVRYFACLSLLAYAGFPVSAVTNPKGDISVKVTVPKESEIGKTADLRCEWNLREPEKLYSVKWYKDDHEFFRYVPKNLETMQTFDQQGVKLDKKSMSKNSIRLTNLTFNSTGQYKCEVSTEAPSFAIEYKTGNLTVISLPERAPEITGLTSHYAVGENVTANCTAWPSIPRATLQWTINGKPVPADLTIIHETQMRTWGLGMPNSLGLRLDADPRHFEGGDGSVSIRCIATVGSRRMETEKTVHMAHVNNQRLSAGDLRGGAATTIGTKLEERVFLLITTVAILFAT